MNANSLARRRHYHHGVIVAMAWSWRRLPDGQIAQTMVTTIRGRGPVATMTGRYFASPLDATQETARLNKGLGRRGND
jgi:hypothetical protein